VEGVFRAGLSKLGFMRLSKKLDEHKNAEMLGKKEACSSGPDGCKLGRLVLDGIQVWMH